MKKKILIAPLNWGLGHATRCIPIINALLQHNFIPVMASDGAALALLSKEFSDLEAVELPSYNITYPRNGSFLKFKLLTETPKILKTIRQEQDTIKSIVKSHSIDGIISDNRFGVYHHHLPSVFITHQLKVLSGHTTWLSTKLHQNIIKKFDECWVPDVLGEPNLSGKMGHVETSNLNIKYIGPLSRFQKIAVAPSYDIMVVLSGPEPQRAILEEKLLKELKQYRAEVLFVKGIVENEQTIERSGNVIIHNFMTTAVLEKSLNSSELIIARSGYTTIMDLAKLGKKTLFIPTPGQFEQNYLAHRMQEQNLAPFCKQDDFSLEHLKGIDKYKGLKTFENASNFQDLFHLFQSK